MKKILFGGVIVLILIAGGWFYRKQILPQPKPANTTKALPIFSGLGYVAVDPTRFELTLLSDRLTNPTRIKITPDGKYLLVAEISGQAVVFNRNGDSWDKNFYPLVRVDTHFPGFPPEEGGLVGLVFSADYAKNGKLFLFYSYKNRDGKIYNRVSVTSLESRGDKLVASSPKQIFEASIPGTDSHQITDGLGVKIADQPELLFAVGEGIGTTRAQNPSIESGKIMLISEDGSNPTGLRPFPEDPKVQAIGLRNAYNLAQDSDGRVIIADTGPNRFDRIIDIVLYNQSGAALRPINLGWNGLEDDLAKPVPDPNFAGVKDAVVLRLTDTLTFTGLAFHPGKGAIPKSTNAVRSVLLTVYGKTGSTLNSPGKEIWLGRLTSSSGQPSLTVTPIVKRNPDAAGKYGNPIGLEVDPQTGNFFFADIIEGRIYQVTPR